MNKTIIGLFSRALHLRESVSELEKMGLNAEHISLITSDKIDKNSFEITTNTKIPETAGAGAVAGGTLGLIVGGLAAIGSVATGGIGLLASGPVVASLTAGAFGAGGGGILGAVIGTTIPDTELQPIIDEIESGSVLLVVECAADEEDKVRQVLKSHQAKTLVKIDKNELEELKGQ
jgi:uncharacterized membrane protein